jgi:hypothetical protein
MNKLLKFKDFSILLESIINEGSSYRTKYWDSYKVNVSDKPPVNTKKNELIRASFGQDSTTDREISDTVKNNITKMFSNVLDRDGKGESIIRITKFLPGENRVDKSHGSGDMVTYLVTTDKNDEGYLITNNSTSTKVKIEGEIKLFRPKELTPGNLKISDVDYTSKDDLIISSIGAIKAKVTDELHLKFILKLIDVCGDPKKYGFAGVEKDSIDEVLGDYTVNCEFSEFDQIEKLGNLGNIQNDFGEILGAIFVFNLVKQEAIGGGVHFPSGNEKLLDFSFNGKDISSKAGSGAAATITEYIKRIEDAVDKGWILTPEQLEAKERILRPLSLAEESKESRPIKWFGKRSKGSGVFTGSIQLFNSLNLPGWITFKKEFNISDSNDINRDDIIDSFDKLGMSGRLLSSLNAYRKSVKFDPGSSNPLFLGIIDAKNVKESKNSWINLIKSQKTNPAEYDECLTLLIGSVLYPCSNEVTNYIYKVEQPNGETYMKIVNDMINHAVSVNQLNLSISLKKDSINFSMYSSQKSSYKIQGLNSFGDPLMANFKIKKQ